MNSPLPSPEQPLSGQFRAEYARRMNAVLDHIDRHLDTPLEAADDLMAWVPQVLAG